MQTDPTHQWHHTTAADTLERLAVDAKHGLSLASIAERRQRYGFNELTVARGPSALRMFLLQFHQPLIYILLASGIITAALNELIDASVIFGVVLVNAVIGYLQESKATTAIAALARSFEIAARVVRDGTVHTVAARELVPGDIVLLQSGDRVPADVRLLHCRELRLDESALTGESIPVHKQSEPLALSTPLAERLNIAFSSSLVTYGTGRGVVVATGNDTEIGRIQKLITAADALATPLTRRIAAFSRLLLWVILGLAALTFVMGVMRGEAPVDMLMAAVALAVGAIPEGLPAAVTITLAIGVSRMAQRHAIIRKLPAVETLGSTTVICSDKTGTLTQNQMTVREIFSADQRIAVTGIGYAPEGALTSSDADVSITHNVALRECLYAGVLCNDATWFVDGKTGRIEGDPTEAALVVAAHKAGITRDDLARKLPRIDAVAFEAQHQYMATLHDTTPGVARVVYVKGAVERILERCHDQLDTQGNPVPLAVAAIHAEATRMAQQGLRVLAFARVERPAYTTTLTHSDIASGLTFLGVQGMIDPPRPEAVLAIAACRRAGIKVKMITGDHIGTATAIARQLGLGTPPDAPVHALSGHALQQLSKDELVARVAHTDVFARVAPEQKLQLVEALQAQGHVVAMTGDGVNDAPALRQADIGVAMGLTGTEVAKEAADMVLTDDNFSTIEAAVEEGRGVYDNLIKFITWTLPTNIGEGLVILVAVFAGISLPITPVQILWINMTTAVLLGLMLAFERNETGIMQRAPRDPRAAILDTVLTRRIVFVGVLLLIAAFGVHQWELVRGASEATARTAAVNVFVFGELFYLFNCRSLTRDAHAAPLLSNPWLIVGIALMILAQILFTHVPMMNAAFGSAPLSIDEWLMVTALGFLIYPIIEIEKKVL